VAINLRLPEFFLFNQHTRRVFLEIIRPVLNQLVRMKIDPNTITITGCLLSLVAGIFFSTGNFYVGGWVVALAGTCDVLDGQLSRVTGQSSRFGAFYDSFLDRVSEAVIFMGLAWYFAGGQPFFWSPNADHPDRYSPFVVMLIFLTITGSFLTSYVKARAEALDITCDVGRMQRTERFVLLMVASALGSIPHIGLLLMKTSMAVFAVLANATALHRFLYAKKKLLHEQNIDKGKIL